MRRVFSLRTKSGPGLLVMSGLDGTGKSTQAGILAARLRNEGCRIRPVWNRWEPTLSAPLIRLARRRINPEKDAATDDYENFTRAKRQRMRNPWKRRVWQLMVWSEYALQVNLRLFPYHLRIEGAICDRYVYDTLVDIAINFSIEPDEITGLCNHPLLALYPKPSLVLFIDIDPETGAKRKNDGTPAQYLADRRNHYLAIARILDAPVVDGGGSIDEVTDRIWELTSGWRETLPGYRGDKTAP